MVCRAGERAAQRSSLLQVGREDRNGGSMARGERFTCGRLQEQTAHCSEAVASQQARPLPHLDPRFAYFHVIYCMKIYAKMM